MCSKQGGKPVDVDFVNLPPKCASVCCIIIIKYGTGVLYPHHELRFRCVATLLQTTAAAATTLAVQKRPFFVILPLGSPLETSHAAPRSLRKNVACDKTVQHHVHRQKQINDDKTTTTTPRRVRFLMRVTIVQSTRGPCHTRDMPGDTARHIDGILRLRLSALNFSTDLVTSEYLHCTG